MTSSKRKEEDGWMEVKPAWPGSYPDTQRLPTKLYLIVDGGSDRWWVSAHSPERAVAIIFAHQGEPILEWEDAPPSVREVTRDDVIGDNFTFEDGTKCKLWNAFELVRGFEVMLATTLI